VLCAINEQKLLLLTTSKPWTVWRKGLKDDLNCRLEEGPKVQGVIDGSLESVKVVEEKAVESPVGTPPV
jgi:hypothetical protein